MDLISLSLFALLFISALSIFFFEDLLYIVLIFGAYSVILSLLWIRMQATDIAITEAAVGLGSMILFIVVMTKIGRRPE